jgi:hypothetical protein
VFQLPLISPYTGLSASGPVGPGHRVAEGDAGSVEDSLRPSLPLPLLAVALFLSRTRAAGAVEGDEPMHVKKRRGPGRLSV